MIQKKGSSGISEEAPTTIVEDESAVGSPLRGDRSRSLARWRSPRTVEVSQPEDAEAGSDSGRFPLRGDRGWQKNAVGEQK